MSIKPSITINIHSFVQRPDLIEQSDELLDKLWPQFMCETAVCDEYWEKLYEEPMNQFQFLAVADIQGTEKVVGVIKSVLFQWPDHNLTKLVDLGWDDIFNFAIENKNGEDRYISALSVTVEPEYRGYQIPALLINALKKAAVAYGAKAVVVPVRPTLKHRYPLQPFDDYCRWTNEQGEPFDPWIRTHWRLGGKILKPIHRSMSIKGTVEQWESWTGMRFIQSGQYVVPNALVPVTVDIEKQSIEYIEPNLWMLHSLEKA
ncbi:transferase [Providencia vermicola]|uniref:Transferase n=2 Tax=Providencia TaxID=586 RepID=A0AAI9I1J5_PROST|nr:MULTISPECIES: transferase [Providencia]ELR5036673.1 transferase [Providencia stuartii]ELR5122770.1 transferase [Providencia stuartii]ELR5144025.1 transferase [Providencia stuartii]ELX8380029.1 transferase [Providencia stuartii]ELZ5940819.1 transferase [Providencia stuartii]